MLRTHSAELDGRDEPRHLTVNDLETVRLHEFHHWLVHGLAPRCTDGDGVGAELREGVHERRSRSCRGPSGSVFHALDQLAVIAPALGESRSGRREHDGVYLGIGELAALRLELEHAAHLLLRSDVAVGHAPGVQRDARRQRRGKLGLLRRVGGGRQQAQPVRLFDPGHVGTRSLRAFKPRRLDHGVEFFRLGLDIARELLRTGAAYGLGTLA